MSFPKQAGGKGSVDLKEMARVEVHEATQGDSGLGNLVPISIEAIPTNTALPCTLYLKVGERFLSFRRQGERLTSRSVIALLENGGRTLHLHKAFWTLFEGALAGLKLPTAPGDADRKNHFRHVLAAYGREMNRKAREPKKPIFDVLRMEAQGIAAKIRANPRQGLSMVRKNEDPLQYFVHHAYNAAVYGTLIGIRLDCSLRDLGDLTFSCLVHDIGNLYLPKRLLYKRDKFTEEDWEILRCHPRRGADLLQSLGCPPSAVLTAYQHHERYDGSGYPQGLRGSEIHVFARVAAVADMYDALTSNRPHQGACDPAKAIEMMGAEKGKFEPAMIEIFEAVRG